MISRPQRQMMLLTAVAALGSRLPACTAFAPPRSLPHDHFSVTRDNLTAQTRLYSSSGDGFLTRLAKNILPKSLTQSKEERQSELARTKLKKEMKSGISAMLKDAPLAVRMVGSLIAPILSGVASSMQEAQQQTEDLYNDAVDLILSDPDATRKLGEPIMVQPPFSQSSSSSSINGQTSSRIQVQFQVEGTRSSGVATMVASETGIQSLALNVGGELMSISLLKSAGGSGGRRPEVLGGSSSSSSFGRKRINEDDVIDVEFVEKKESKP